jgi:1-phosphatidylinositol-4-phosphate 5-kinase
VRSASAQPFVAGPIDRLISESVKPGMSMTQALAAAGMVDKKKTFGVRKYKGGFKVGDAQTKKETKKKKKIARRKEKGKKEKYIHNMHEQYALTFGMMLGIRVAVGRQFDVQAGSAAKLDHVTLSVQDFMHVDTYTFQPGGTSSTPPYNSPHFRARPFKFKDYAPLVFRRLRARFGIQPDDYMLSLCGNAEFIEFISNSKSGQFFFFSHDKRYMIKTQSKDESKFLRRVMPHYTDYMLRHPNSLINRFYGMHRVKMKHLRRRMHFVIMGSIFDAPVPIYLKYDLKGATYQGRSVSKTERIERRAQGKGEPVLKDLNMTNNGQRIRLGTEERKALFLNQIESDAQFLARLSIMDYSLLIGVHNRDKSELAGALTDLEVADARALRAEMKEQRVKSLLSEKSAADGLVATNRGGEGKEGTEGKEGGESEDAASPTDATDVDTDAASDSDEASGRDRAGTDGAESEGGDDGRREGKGDDGDAGDDGSRLAQAADAAAGGVLHEAAAKAVGGSHIPIFQQEEGGFYGRSPDGSFNGEVYYMGTSVAAGWVRGVEMRSGEAEWEGAV